MEPAVSDSIRHQYQEQINHLFRLAEEAESCAKLLRQEAQRHQKALDAGDIDEQTLQAMISEREAHSVNLRITDSLM